MVPFVTFLDRTGGTTISLSSESSASSCRSDSEPLSRPLPSEPYRFRLFFLETTEDESLSLGLEGSTNGSNFSERRLERLLFFLRRLHAVLDPEDDPESLELSLESLPDGDEGDILFLFEVPSAWAI